MCHLTDRHALATKKENSCFKVWFGKMTNTYLTELFATICFVSFLNMSDMKVSHLALKNMTFMHLFSMH